MQRGTKEYRLRQSVYRLGYALYAMNLHHKDGRSGKFVRWFGDMKFFSYRDLVFYKWESLRTQLHKEYGVMW